MLGLARQLVDAEPMLARHRGDLLPDAVPGSDEERGHQHRRLKPRLADQGAEGGRPAQAPSAEGVGCTSLSAEKGGHRSSRAKWFAIASARPAAVCSAATAAMWNPDCRASAAVTGPMQKAGRARARWRPIGEASRVRPRTLEPLAKLTPSRSC